MRVGHVSLAACISLTYVSPYTHTRSMSEGHVLYIITYLLIL